MVTIFWIIDYNFLLIMFGTICFLHLIAFFDAKFDLCGFERSNAFKLCFATTNQKLLAIC